MQQKERLDVLLLKRGLYQSRERAQAAIMSGCVYIDNQKADKPGTKLNEDIAIEIREDNMPYVSRGGLKLAKALEVFNIDVKDLVALDAGASTGGFTDCLLQNGAKKVYAVDVGYGQLAWELRNDARVKSMERINVRYLKSDQIGETIDIVTSDVSFISVTKIIPAILQIISEDSQMVCLVKPQFEAGREKVGKKGVVREPQTHIEVLQTTVEFMQGVGFNICGLDFSPIKGPEGNIEFLLYMTRGTKYSERHIGNVQYAINEVVARAHGSL